MRLRLLLGVLGPALATAAVGCGGKEFSDAAYDGGSGSSGAGVNDSGPADTGVSKDAGASWCDGQTTAYAYCEDFDEYASNASGISALVGAWPTFEQSNGTFSFDTNAAPSPPNALDANGSNGADVVIAREIGATLATKVLRLEFDLRVDKAGTLGPLSAAGFASISFGKSLDAGFAALAIGQGPSLAAYWQLPAGSDAGLANSFKSQQTSGVFPTLGTWAGRYAVEVDYTGDGAQRTGCLQVYEGPTPLLSPCLALPPQLLDPTNVAIAIGDYAGGTDQTGNVELEFDNVTFSEN